MYKCNDCNLIISELIDKCPKCGAEDSLKSHDINERVIYELSVEDYESALNELSDEEREVIEKLDEKKVIENLKRKLYIPASEYITEHLRASFIYSGNMI